MSLGLSATINASSAYPTQKIITTVHGSTSDNVFLALSQLETMKMRFNQYIVNLQLLLSDPTALEVVVAFYNIITKVYIAYLTALNKVYPCEKAIFEGISNVFQALFPLSQLELTIQISLSTSLSGAGVIPVPFDPSFLVRTLLQSLYDTLIYLFALTDNLPDECQKCYFYKIIFGEAKFYLPAILQGLASVDSALSASMVDFIARVTAQLDCLPDGKAKCKVYVAIVNLLRYLLNVVLFAGPVSIAGFLPVIYDPMELGRLICKIVKYLPCECRETVQNPVIQELTVASRRGSTC